MKSREINIETEKELLIERFRSVNDLALIKAVRLFLDLGLKGKKNGKIKDLFGIIEPAEAEELENIIHDGCEGIDRNEW